MPTKLTLFPQGPFHVRVAIDSGRIHAGIRLTRKEWEVAEVAIENRVECAIDLLPEDSVTEDDGEHQGVCAILHIAFPTDGGANLMVGLSFGGDETILWADADRETVLTSMKREMVQ